MKFSAFKVLAIGGAVLGASAASATSFTFNLTNQNQSASAYNDLTFTPSGTSKLSLDVYGAHMNDTKVSSTSALNSVSAATVAAWSGYGVGVLFGSDNTGNETHQIDNVGGGVDFVVLSFNQAVTLSGYGLKAYGIDGYGTDSDSSYMAYTGNLSDLLGGVNKGAFTSVASNSTGTVTTNSSVTSAVWLIAAAVSDTNRNDGFKLTSLSVSQASPSAVPEPATWAMMLVGFGAIGSTLRSRRIRPNVAVTFG